jgi:3-oxoacyl-[acyl-carrier protein] reductase
MLLKDKVAIVTGGTKGIGRAISLLFAEEGARVVANFSKDVEAAEGLISEAQSKRLSLGLFKADVTQFDQVKQMVEDVFAEYGRIDILVNNVGLIRDNFLMLMSDDDWDSLMKVNLNSLFYCCNLLASRAI